MTGPTKQELFRRVAGEHLKPEWDQIPPQPCERLLKFYRKQLVRFIAAKGFMGWMWFFTQSLFSLCFCLIKHDGLCCVFIHLQLG